MVEGKNQSPEPNQKIVAEGTWFYDGSCEKSVYIIEQNYDYWFEMKKVDGEVEPGEKAELNESGLVYYLRFTPISGMRPWGVESNGHQTIDEAKACAAEKAPSPIEWNNR